MLEFQQSEDTAVRRRWIIVLVSSTDGVTGLTGQTGQVYISKNGGTPALSTNSIVEVDSTNMPGHYYIELTASELDTLGHISITKKTASSLAFHDRAIVSYNDPYASAGGFSGGGSGETFKLTKKHIQSIAEEVWKYKVEEEISAQEKLILASNHPVVDLSGLDAGIKSIRIPETDLTPVLEKVDSIVDPIMKAISSIIIPEVKFPEIKNYESQLSLIIGEMEKLPKEFPEPEKVIIDYERIESGIERVLVGMKKLDAIEELVQQSSDSITGKLGESELAVIEELKQRLSVVLEYLINFKYDLEIAQLDEPKEITNI